MNILSFLASTEILGQLDNEILEELIEDLEWLEIPGGTRLIKQGELGDSLYIVVNGRLRATIINEKGEEKSVGEVGRGECVGEMALLTQELRSANVYTVRDTHLLKLSQAGFNHLVNKHPQALIQISRILVKRLRDTIHSSHTHHQISTITVITTDREIPISEFTHNLVSKLSQIGSTLHLNSKYLEHYTNREKELITWLNEQENKYNFLIYEADPQMSTWTEYSLRQADKILILAQSNSKPELDQLKKIGLVEGNNSLLARKELILLHNSSRRVNNFNTQSWLSTLTINTHHHIRMKNSQDMHRLARLITGNAVALVLGGGGARGLAHVGVLKALEEAKIPIDLIGGTSMGAIVGAMSAFGLDAEVVSRKLKASFRRVGEIFDLTLPLVSLTTGQKIVTALRTNFGDTQIEDLWINFFCVSSNLTRATVMVHDTGCLWRCLRASCALPGIIPPIMYNGDLLLDGGLLKNLPVDVMQSRCDGGKVITVDVSPKIELQVACEFGDSVSGWQLLWNQINPYTTPDNVPHILTILSQATVLSSRYSRASLSLQDKDIFYINPPLDDVKILDFESINTIIDIGYEATVKKLENSTF